MLRDEHGLDIQIAFAGRIRGHFVGRTYHHVMRLARQQRIAGRVKILGYVPERDMAPLYAGTRALVMPTFFGPTKSPLLEAWACGCPVITSNIPGIAEQMSSAAALVDPRSVESIAQSIARVWTDESLSTQPSISASVCAAFWRKPGNACDPAMCLPDPMPETTMTTRLFVTIMTSCF